VGDQGRPFFLATVRRTVVATLDIKMDSMCFRDGGVIFINCCTRQVCKFHHGEFSVVAGEKWVEAEHGYGEWFADGPLATARFRDPQGIALCADNSLVVADFGNHRIRKISPLGFVSPLAGRQRGFGNGAGADAKFNGPIAVAVRADNSIVVTDSNNCRIRLISPDCFVTPLAGSGEDGFADGSEARFKRPYGVAVCPDGGVLVCDRGNHRLRRVSVDGTVSTVAGSGAFGHLDEIGGSATFAYPTSIAVDTAGHAVIGESGGYVRKIVLATGEVTTVGYGIGHAVVTALAIDDVGSVVFFNRATKTLSQIAGAGLGPGFSAAGFAPLWTPTRKCHNATPEWTRAAVRTVMLLAKRATNLGGGAFGAGWLERVVVLPPTVWEMIIGLIPIHQIGRAGGPVTDPGLDLWPTIAAANGWGHVGAALLELAPS
jgi:hypothetical protein